MRARFASMDSVGPVVPITTVATHTVYKVLDGPYPNTEKVTSTTYEVTTYDKNGKLTTSTNVYQTDYLV